MKLNIAMPAKLVSATLLFGLGFYFILQSFTVAASGLDRDSMFSKFWLGTLLATVPFVVILISKTTPNWLRYVSLFGLGGTLTLPKMLRSLSGPVFHDEYAHLRAVDDILINGVPGTYNSIVTPVPFFDGMHQVTAFLSRISGLDSWTSSLIIISISHISLLFVVYGLLRALKLSNTAAGIGTSIYVTNANYMYFHGQFGYESLGITIGFGTLLVAILAINANKLLVKSAYIALISGLSYSVAAVHHLSAFGYIFLVIIAIIALTYEAFKSKSYGRLLTALTILVVSLIMIYIRLIPAINLLLEYIGTPVTRGATQLSEIIAQFLGTTNGSDSSRTLFEGSQLPAFEKIASLSASMIIGITFLLFLWTKFKESRLGQPILEKVDIIAIGFSLTTLLYIFSVPFILTAGGAEGARRSWGYSFIGVAIIIGLLFAYLINKTNKAGYVLGSVGFITVWSVMLVGGVAAGVNETYRFPQPLKNISDLTASTAEAQALGLWFKANSEENAWVLADRYSGMQIGSYGRAQIAPPSKSFPYWEMYWGTDAPTPEIVAGMKALNVQYVVVDARMELTIPENGFWFETGEPREPRGSGNPPAEPGALSKFENLGMFNKVFETENYKVYSVDYGYYNPFTIDKEVSYVK